MESGRVASVLWVGGGTWSRLRAPSGQGGRRREPTAEVRPPGGGKGWAENAQNFSGGRDLTPDSSMTQILGCLTAAVKSGANPGKEMGVVSSPPPTPRGGPREKRALPGPPEKPSLFPCLAVLALPPCAPEAPNSALPAPCPLW